MVKHELLANSVYIVMLSHVVMLFVFLFFLSFFHCYHLWWIKIINRPVSAYSAYLVIWHWKDECCRDEPKGWEWKKYNWLNLARVCWKSRQGQLHCDIHSSSSLHSQTKITHCMWQAMCLYSAALVRYDRIMLHY